MSQLSLSRSPYRSSLAQRSFWGRRSRSSFGSNYRATSRSPFRADLSSNQPAPKALALPKINFQFGPAALIMALLAVIIFIGMAYLAHFNRIATKGYNIKKLEADRQQLLSENQIKDARLAQSKSLTNIIDAGRLTGMRKAPEIIFVRGDNAIASANTY